jgi:hypothetical protein
MSEDTCSFCGRWPTDGAHVKPEDDCEPNEKDDSSNIIDLCPTCHARMDRCNQIALSAGGSMYLLMTASNDIEARETERQYNASNEYIEERNAKAKTPLIRNLSKEKDEKKAVWPI